MPNDKFDPKEFASHDEADDLHDADDGSNPNSTQDTDEEEDDGSGSLKREAKKVASEKPAPKKDDEEDDADKDDKDEEDDADKDDKDDADKDDKTAGKKGNPRLERMRAQRDRALLELNEIKKQQAAATATQSDAAKQKLDKINERRDALYEEIEEHRAAGKTKEAAKAQRELDDINSNLTRSQAAAVATREAMQATEIRVFNTMVNELEAIDPRFDKDSDDFDDELLESVNELVEAYEAKGLSMTDALRKACKTILREDVFSKKSKAQAPDLRREKKQDAPEAKGKDVAKKVDAARRQPPQELNVTRERSRVVDVMSMGEKDFDKLTDEQLAEMDGSRG